MRNLGNDLSIRREQRHAQVFGSDQDREGDYQVPVASGDPMGHDEPVTSAVSRHGELVGTRFDPEERAIP